MATFEELLEQLRTPGENGIPTPEDFAAAHAEAVGIREAAIAEREKQITEFQETIAAKDADNTRLKAVNYDLLVAAPKQGTSPDNAQQDDAGEPAGVDSLFE